MPVDWRGNDMFCHISYQRCTSWPNVNSRGSWRLWWKITLMRFGDICFKQKQKCGTVMGSSPAPYSDASIQEASSIIPPVVLIDFTTFVFESKRYFVEIFRGSTSQQSVVGSTYLQDLLWKRDNKSTTKIGPTYLKDSANSRVPTAISNQSIIV